MATQHAAITAAPRAIGQKTSVRVDTGSGSILCGKPRDGFAGSSAIPKVRRINR